MSKSRRKFSSAFKTKVALEALKERKTIPEFAEQFELRTNQISAWKKEFFENAKKVFGEEKGQEQLKASEKDKEYLYK